MSVSKTESESPNSKAQKNFKVLIVGESGVGKTSLLKRLLGEEFKPELQTTIGVDFERYVLKVEGCEVCLTIWDAGGQEQFRSIVPQFFRKSNGCLIVFDVTDKRSFDEVKFWLGEVKQYAPNSSFLLVGNKVDLVDSREVERETAEDFCESLDISYQETSARTAFGIKEAFRRLAERMIISERFRSSMIQHSDVEEDAHDETTITVVDGSPELPSCWSRFTSGILYLFGFGT